MEQVPLLEARKVSKIYPNGVVANHEINFSVVEGEIHALAGENGAGKSTLMKMLFGMEQPSQGNLYFKGEPMNLSSSQDAIAMGLGMVHQHFMLVPSFTVAENMILGVEPKKGIAINYQEAIDQTRAISEKYNLQVDPLERVENLSVGMKQKVEILKALYRGAKVLILDEPTAVLTPQETEELFIQLRKFKEMGFTVIFISHKLKEIKAICDRITIMRGGKDMGVYAVPDITETEISRLMVGRDVVLKYERSPNTESEQVLRLEGVVCRDLHGKAIVNEIYLHVKKGEILGVAGVDGNGQSELARCIMGDYPIESGKIFIGQDQVQNLGIRKVRKHNVSYIPEDRLSQGVAGDAPIEDNLISVRYRDPEVSKKEFLATKKIKSLSGQLIEDFCVLCKNSMQKVSMLSGGNMQKVVVAREFSNNPKLVVIEQLTRGVDVGSAQFIHEKLLELRKQGCAILLISADLNEVVELSDRLIVMYEGNITAVYEEPTKVPEETLGLSMLGMNKMSPEDVRRVFS